MLTEDLKKMMMMIDCEFDDCEYLRSNDNSRPITTAIIRSENKQQILCSEILRSNTTIFVVS